MVQTISTASRPIATEEAITNMLIATAITTQVQSSTAPGGAGPSGGGPQEEEAEHQVEEEAEAETPRNPPLVMENPWACCPPYLKGITLKLRAFSESSPPISSLTTMSQLSLHSSKELPSPSLASKDQRSIDGPNSSSNG